MVGPPCRALATDAAMGVPVGGGITPPHGRLFVASALRIAAADAAGPPVRIMRVIAFSRCSPAPATARAALPSHKKELNL